MKGLGELNPGHVTILQALETANRAHGRAVTIAEIIEALPPSELERLVRTYKNPPIHSITHSLKLLGTPRRNLVYALAYDGRYRCYASTRVFSRDDVKLPEPATNAHIVLKLVRAAALEKGRAILIEEATGYAEGKEEYERLDAFKITNAIGQLHQKGKLDILKMARGTHRNYYLPTDMDADAYMPTVPVSWLDEVEQAYNELWQARLEEAASEGRLPRPLTTRDVRTYLEQKGSDNPKSVKHGGLTDALWELSKHKNSPLRRISRRRRKSLMWAPAGVPDEALDLQNAYTSDTERIKVAVQRAVARHERPVVMKEIADEIDADSALNLRGRHISIANAVVGMTSYLDEDGRSRVSYKHTPGYIQSLGLVGPKTYYVTCDEDARPARAYVEFKRLELQWKALRADEDLYALEGCRLPSVAAGRTMLLAAEAERILTHLRTLIADSLLSGRWAEEAETLCGLITEVYKRTRSWPAVLTMSAHKLPEEIDVRIPLMTRDEVRDLLAPIYPAVERKRRASETCYLTALLSKRIRRISVEGMRARCFDRTGVYLFAAERFGGYECGLQAGLAGAELGPLRDARFIHPAVESVDVDVRLAAFSCLAFLPSEKGNDLLKQAAMKDSDPGLRASALWSYAFAQGEWAQELAGVLMKHDPAAEVREFAARVYETDATEIWRL